MASRIRRVRTTTATAHVTAMSTTKRRADMSRQVDIDSSVGTVGGLVPITPPYSIDSLGGIYDKSNMLKQCIAAMVTNVAMTGFDVVPVHKDIPVDEAEREMLQSFVDNANSEESLSYVNTQMCSDYEQYGFGFVEVIRDAQGRVSILRHGKAAYIRVCPKNPEPVLVTYDVVRGPRTSFVRELKTFRVYVQMVGGRKTYFKEFGDPRKLDYVTGQFESSSYAVSKEREATELLHFRQHSDDVYGVPRWINQLPSILGSREAEEVNLRYFEDNTVPPMILSVSGGRLTGESYRELRKLLSSSGLGKERQNQILLIEAVPERESIDDKGSVQLRVDKLTDTRQSDGLFKAYDDANQAKVRSSFRLPPVAVGLSQDVTFATANVSAFLAESQVYAPQRALFDEFYNKKLVNNERGLGLKTVKLRSRTPAITDPEGLMKSLTALNVMGALTPRMAQVAAAQVLRVTIEEYPQKGEEGYEDWMDRPILFETKGRNTQAEQEQKDQDIKDVEDTGDTSLQAPENGQQ